MSCCYASLNFAPCGGFTGISHHNYRPTLDHPHSYILSQLHPFPSLPNMATPSLPNMATPFPSQHAEGVESTYQTHRRSPDLKIHLLSNFYKPVSTPLTLKLSNYMTHKNM